MTGMAGAEVHVWQHSACHTAHAYPFQIHKFKEKKKKKKTALCIFKGNIPRLRDFTMLWACLQTLALPRCQQNKLNVEGKVWYFSNTELRPQPPPPSPRSRRKRKKVKRLISGYSLFVRLGCKTPKKSHKKNTLPLASFFSSYYTV